MFFHQPFVFLCSYFVHHRRVNSFMLINHFSFYNMPVFSFEYQKGNKGTIMGTVITTQLLSELHDVRGKALREVENIPETILIEGSCHQRGSLQVGTSPRDGSDCTRDEWTKSFLFLFLHSWQGSQLRMGLEWIIGLTWMYVCMNALDWMNCWNMMRLLPDCIICLIILMRVYVDCGLI